MKVHRADIDWQERFRAEPKLLLHVDVVPRIDEVEHTSLMLDGGEVLYVGTREDGYAHFLLHNPRNGRGFGGSVFVLPMADGSEEHLVGPWSSRAGVVNAYGAQGGWPDIVDVVLLPQRGGRMAGAVTLKLAREWVATLGDVELRADAYMGDRTWVVARIGEPTKREQMAARRHSA
jgi:hypothetical protein